MSVVDRIAMVEKIGRDPIPRTFKSIEVNFERIFQVLKALNEAAGGTVDLSAIEDALEELQDEIDDIIANPPAHDLLSVTHPDTEVNPPARGAVIVGVPTGGVDDAEAFWSDGLVLAALSTDLDPGVGLYWGDGLTFGILVAAAGAEWQRLVPSAAGQVLTFDGVNTVWT